MVKQRHPPAAPMTLGNIASPARKPHGRPRLAGNGLAERY
jgi:hypothetical protein